MTELEEEHRITAPPQILELGNIIVEKLLEKYPVKELMEIIKKNSSKGLFVAVSRENPEKVSLIVDTTGKFCYCCEEPLLIPIPKKFAVLEPDTAYFENTLRANIYLALMKASHEELHR
jgi:hypothetical protein